MKNDVDQLLAAACAAREHFVPLSTYEISRVIGGRLTPQRIGQIQQAAFEKIRRRLRLQEKLSNS